MQFWRRSVNYASVNADKEQARRECLRACNRTRGALGGGLGWTYATTEAAIWTSGDAATANRAKAVRTKVAVSRIEGRVVVIEVSPGARVSMNPVYQTAPE